MSEHLDDNIFASYLYIYCFNNSRWIVLGVAAVSTIVVIGYIVYDSIKIEEKQDSDSYARPGQKTGARKK